MANNNNNNRVPLYNATHEQGNFTYVAHGLATPIWYYASPSLYDFNQGINYPIFGENVGFEMKAVMLQVVQSVS